MAFCGFYSVTNDVHVEEVSMTLNQEETSWMSPSKRCTVNEDDVRFGAGEEEMMPEVLQYSSEGDETSCHNFKQVQHVSETSTSGGLTTDLLDDMDMSLQGASRQSSDCDYMSYLMDDIATALSEAGGRAGLGSLVPGHNFAISVNDPSLQDNPIIAISDEFEAMTGYSSQEIIGSSARFLREDCPDNFHHSMELHSTAITGKPFIGVLTNTRRDGRPFLKLLDQRGFTVAVNNQTGEEHWLLLSLHLDVTDLLDTIDEETLEERIPEIEAVMNRMLGTSEIVDKIMMMMCVLHQRLPQMQKQEWQILSAPTWR